MSTGFELQSSVGPTGAGSKQLNFMAKYSSAIWYEFSHRVSVDFLDNGLHKAYVQDV